MLQSKAMLPDLINGLFESGTVLAILVNCRRLWRDRMLRGYSPWCTVFFTLWGIWNVFYYPYLGQRFSFVAGVCVVLANLFWLSLVWHFSKSDPIL